MNKQLSFQQMKLTKESKDRLKQLGYDTPTPIQQKSFQHVLDGRNLLGLAAAGTGKTLAFALPLLKILPNISGVHCLILTPTRELASQIQKEIAPMAPLGRRSVALAVGGSNYLKQKEAIDLHPPIIVGTPGRITDFVKVGDLDLKETSILILDEVDRMLDMGFLKEIYTIMKTLPSKKQVLLFSATMNSQIEKLILSEIPNPVKVEVGNIHTPVQKMQQVIYQMSREEKYKALYTLLQDWDKKDSGILFARTRESADELSNFMEAIGFNIETLHGGKLSGERRKAIERFKDKKCTFLVATDLAARGIHVDNIHTVFNVDLPDDPENFLHRVGRTARAGNQGRSVTLISHNEQRFWKKIQEFCDLNIFYSPLPPLKEIPQQVKLPEFNKRNKVKSKTEENPVKANEKTFMTGSRKVKRSTGKKGKSKK
ncbi:MAG: DEAD/DEAH box helicase [Candidatus Cloacimonetes bacterium]|nr:DEAD/DEAH box helicase [Candidatus Cloacimonadota bacterium]